MLICAGKEYNNVGLDYVVLWCFECSQYKHKVEDLLVIYDSFLRSENHKRSEFHQSTMKRCVTANKVQKKIMIFLILVNHIKMCKS